MQGGWVQENECGEAKSCGPGPESVIARTCLRRPSEETNQVRKPVVPACNTVCSSSKEIVLSPVISAAGTDSELRSINARNVECDVAES